MGWWVCLYCVQGGWSGVEVEIPLSSFLVGRGVSQPLKGFNRWPVNNMRNILNGQRILAGRKILNGLEIFQQLGGVVNGFANLSVKGALLYPSMVGVEALSRSRSSSNRFSF